MKKATSDETHNGFGKKIYPIYPKISVVICWHTFHLKKSASQKKYLIQIPNTMTQF
jgi:hypothetical protein